MSDSRHDLTAADLAAARRREPEAVARVYHAHANAVFRFFLAWTGDKQVACDLTGSVFAAAIQTLPTFRGPVQALPVWLFGIAHHNLGAFRQQRKRSATLPIDSQVEQTTGTGGEADAEAIAIDRLPHDRALAASRHLPAEQREVLLLRMVGLRASEVADVLGTTPGAVTALQRHALMRLAHLLGVLPQPWVRG
jgi:RNA polymerase sigma-70 factor (ECF subfamily)